MRSMMRLLSGLSVLTLVVCSCAIAPAPNNDNTSGNGNDNAPAANDNGVANQNDNGAPRNDNSIPNGNDNTAGGNENDNAVPANDNNAMSLVIFENPESTFKTMDVRDIDGEIVRFDAAAQQMIWVQDGSRFDDWIVDGNKLQNGFFCILFGSEGGVPHAYFTETSTQTICDLVVSSGALTIFATSEKVPQN